MSPDFSHGFHSSVGSVAEKPARGTFGCVVWGLIPHCVHPPNPAIYLRCQQKAAPSPLGGHVGRTPFNFHSFHMEVTAHGNTGLLVGFPLSPSFLVPISPGHCLLAVIRTGTAGSPSRSYPSLSFLLISPLNLPPPLPFSLLFHCPFTHALCKDSGKSSLLGGRIVMTPLGL